MNSLNQPKTRTLGSLLNGQSYSSMGLNSRSGYSSGYACFIKIKKTFLLKNHISITFVS